jgi:hypothetical protein
MDLSEMVNHYKALEVKKPNTSIHVEYPIDVYGEILSPDYLLPTH